MATGTLRQILSGMVDDQDVRRCMSDAIDVADESGHVLGAVFVPTRQRPR